MLIVDSLIISGIRFVLTRLAEAVETEMYDETHMREELLAAQMKLELGEIDEGEFGEIEAQVLDGLREIRERKSAASGSPRSEGQTFTIESVDADLGHREDPER